MSIENFGSIDQLALEQDTADYWRIWHQNAKNSPLQKADAVQLYRVIKSSRRILISNNFRYGANFFSRFAAFDRVYLCVFSHTKFKIFHYGRKGLIWKQFLKRILLFRIGKPEIWLKTETWLSLRTKIDW
ncbi:MAG: hypothetical protein GY820_05615 [Gammaproteobacteria bacterium]|nr:hypothetical protein [Gammaproteobacteria bacterium]